MVQDPTFGDDGSVIVVGAGGHALVSSEILRDAGHTVRGCVASHVGAVDKFERLGVPVLGTGTDPVGLLTQRGAVFVAIGHNWDRKRVTEAAAEDGHVLVTAVSPTTAISPSCSIGPGALTMPGAVINAFAHIGTGVIVNSGAIVEHECVVGDFAHIAPGAVLSGNVHVGEGTLVGVGARVIPGIRIGAWATVGAGAVVIEDVPDGATVVGVPACVISTADVRR